MTWTNENEKYVPVDLRTERTYSTDYFRLIINTEDTNDILLIFYGQDGEELACIDNIHYIMRIYECLKNRRDNVPLDEVLEHSMLDLMNLLSSIYPSVSHIFEELKEFLNVVFSSEKLSLK